jgi:hypothetical protein
MSPAVNDPVIPLMTPTIGGPTKPAKIALALMNAIPPAAAAPDRKVNGIARRCDVSAMNQSETC